MGGSAPRLSCVLVLALVTTGCTGALPVDPDTAPPFTLTVRVESGAPVAGPVEGARVTFTPTPGNESVNVTGPDGRVTFAGPVGATARVTVLADEWLSAETVAMRLGGPAPGSVVGEVGFALVCVFTLGAVCFTGEDFVLDGSDAQIIVTLAPPAIERNASVHVPAHPPATPADAPEWWPVEFPLADDPEVHALLMQHVRSVDVTLAWENALTARAGLALAVGCVPDAPEAIARGKGPGSVIAESAHEVTLSWEPVVDAPGASNAGWASAFEDPPCARVHAGPLQESGGSGVDASLALAFTLREVPQVPRVT